MIVKMIRASHNSEEYQSEGWLGTGGFATVERVRHRKSAKVYARKIIKLRPPLDLETCRQEITVMEKLKHRHVVPLISSEILTAKIELVLPLADGDLATYLDAYQGSRKNNRTPDDGNHLKEWIGCLASGLTYLHGESVRHKDIKPGNILTMRDRVLYTDFGIARDFTDPRFEVTSGTPIGTPLYYAPEVSQGKKRGKSADVFSLGCVYLEMLVCLSDWSFKKFSEDRFGHDNSRVYHANIDSVLAMLDSLIMENNDMGLYPAFVQCKRMIHEIPLLRPSAQSINNLLCARAHIGCKKCVDKGGEEKTVVVEIPGILGPRAGPKTSNIWTLAFGIIIFAFSAFMLWYPSNRNNHAPLPPPSITSSQQWDNGFATHKLETPFSSKAMDLEVDVTLSVSTPQERSSLTTIVQQSTDNPSKPQPVIIPANQQQTPRPLQSSWKRLGRKFMLEILTGFAFDLFCLVLALRAFNKLTVALVSVSIVVISLLWGQHDPGDFWEMSITLTSVSIHTMSFIGLLALSCWIVSIGIELHNSKKNKSASEFAIGLAITFLTPYISGWILILLLNRWVLFV